MLLPSQGVLKNVIFSHPEDRNAHNSVFGGFLMRQALELSWACCYQFCKTRGFRLRDINDITFSKPVPGNELYILNIFQNLMVLYLNKYFQCHRC